MINLIKSPFKQFVNVDEYFIPTPLSGVYCLFNKIEERPYIGSSKNLISRILGHFKAGKRMDEWMFWIVEITHNLREREKFYIRILDEAGVKLYNKQLYR